MVRTLSQGEPICSGGINFLSQGLPSVLTHRILHGIEARIFVISLCQSKDIPVKLKEGFFFCRSQLFKHIAATNHAILKSK